MRPGLYPCGLDPVTLHYCIYFLWITYNTTFISFPNCIFVPLGGVFHLTIRNICLVTLTFQTLTQDDLLQVKANHIRTVSTSWPYMCSMKHSSFFFFVINTKFMIVHSFSSYTLMDNFITLCLSGKCILNEISLFNLMNLAAGLRCR